MEFVACRATPPESLTLIISKPVLFAEFCSTTPVGSNEAGSSGSSATTLRISVVKLTLNADTEGGV